MKKTIILVALIFVSIVTIAQTKYGVRAGMTLSTYASAQSNYEFKPGVHIGGVADIPLGSSKFSFVPGVYLADKGTKINSDDSYEDASVPVYYYKEVNYNYQLEIPLLFTYKIPINEKLSLKPQIGAYISYGLFQIIKGKRDYLGIVSQNYPTEYTSYHYFYEDNSFSLSYGGNLGLSAFYNKYSFTLSCDVGSLFGSRLLHYPDICMFFSLGYTF
jgi:hypothetical protein